MECPRFIRTHFRLCIFVSKSQRKGYLSKYNIGIFKMKVFVIKAEIDRFVIHLVTVT